MEIHESVDQREAAIERYFTAYGDVLAKQGSIVATFRGRGNRRTGPYFRVTCRVGGRQVAIYLGPPGELVEGVRERLSQLQQARSERAVMKHVLRSVRRQAKTARQQLDAALVPHGLYRKGHEVRGWRTAVVKWTN